MDAVMALAAQYPVISTILMAMSVARLINKPLFSFLHSVADATPTKKDDEALKSVEASQAYTWVCFMLDYVASVKIGTQAPAAMKQPEAK